MERETQIRAPAKHDSPLVVLLARVESTIRHPRRSRRRGVDVSKIIWPSDFEHAGFLLLPLCFLRVDRSREEGCCARFKFFLPLGRVRELFSLSSRARTHAHARPIDASTCPPPRARFHRLARINVRAQKPTADPSRYTTHRGLSSEGRKPGNYYVSRETRGNPDFFFFLSPVEDFKGIILQHPGETFYAM